MLRELVLAMSIRLRLALWYGALTGLAVLVVSVLTYAVHSRAHYDDLDQTVIGAVQHAVGKTTAAAPEQVAALLDPPATPDIAVRVHAAAGLVLAASGDTVHAPSVDPREVVGRPAVAPYDPLVGLVPLPGAAHPGSGTLALAADASGARWRVYVLPLPAERGAAGAAAGYVLAAAPLARIDTSVARFRWLVAAFGALGAATTLAAAWLLAGRALRPVAVLADTAAAIARSRSFSRRVPAGATASRPSERDELRRLAGTFNEMLASLERAYEAEQRFVSDASHELRAPLTAIQANLELLASRADMEAEARREAVDEALREARRLTKLVAELLALARADAGVPIQRQRVELDRVLLDALRDARHLARGQRLELAGLEPATVHGDPDRLKQLVLILLDNALKYTPPDGEVVAALRRDGGDVVVTVRDTGIGIASEHLPHVFERFYRADSARARDSGGSGLGLPIARWIARQHGGEVTLASEPGAGTEAAARLPAAA